MTGNESGDNLDRFGVERPLVAYARSRGQERLQSPVSDAVLWRWLDAGGRDRSQ